jgi:hypothetical protein
MATTNEPAYLVLARYNRAKWHKLSKNPENDEGSQAEGVAEALFPEEAEAKPLETLTAQGVLLVRTFDSELFAELDTETYRNSSDAHKDLFVDGIYATRTLDVPVGWMAVVDAKAFFSFVEWLSSEDGVLWRVYDIEIFPLNSGWTLLNIAGRVPRLRDDATTEDVYMFMTPRNWS